MAKRYSMTMALESAAFEAACRRVEQRLEAIEKAGKRAALASTLTGGGGPGGGGAGGTAARQVAADQVARIEERYLAKEYAGRVVHQDRLQSIQDRWYLRDYRARGEFERRKLQLAAVAREKAEASEREAAEGREHMLKASLAGATTAALAGINYLAEQYARIRERALEAAEATMKMRGALRIESTLKGPEGQRNQHLKEALALRVATGLNAEEATELTRQFLGSVPIAEQKGNITPEVKQALMVEVGKMVARQGGGAEAAAAQGEMAGLLGQFAKIETVEQGMAMLEQIRQAHTEGRGDDTPLLRQLLKNAGSMVGKGLGFKDIADLAVYHGVSSLTAGPEATAERMRQFNRFTSETKGKGAKYLQRIGIKEGMGLESRGEQLFADMEKAEAKGRDLKTYLAQSVGGGNEEELDAAIQFYSNRKAIRERLARIRGLGPEVGKQQMAANAAYQQTPEGRSGITAALGDVNTAARGISAERYAALLKEAAETKEFQDDEESTMTAAWDRLEGYFRGHMSDPVKEGRRMRLQEIAVGLAEKRARAAGVGDEAITDAYKKTFWGESFTSMEDPHAAEKYVNLLETATAARGGSVAADTGPAMDRLTQAIEENSRLLREEAARVAARGGSVPPALPGRPAPGP